MNKSFIAIIPARYGSTRFPGKPLALLGGKPIIQRVYERVAPLLDDTLVATDDQRIIEAVRAFGGKAVLTSDRHRSGTDRCWEAYTKCGKPYDIVVNVQGDEPFIHRSQLEAIKRCFDSPQSQIATLVKPFDKGCPLEMLQNPNSPKVVINDQGYALYFSRSVIPYLRGKQPSEWSSLQTYYKHIGLYAYTVETLRKITSLPQSPLEKAESLEQLRWLQAGYRIKVAQTSEETIGIDTPDDLNRAEQFLAHEEEM